MRTSIRILLCFFAHSLVADGALAAAEATYRKVEVDAAARAAGFHEADFPYYTRANGCGTDDWKSKLVPEKSHIWEGVDFASSCDQHDRDYMTLGRSRSYADKAFRKNLGKAVDQFLKQTVQQSFDRVVKRTVIDRVPRRVTHTVTERVKKRVKDSLKPWRWVNIGVTETREVVEIVYDVVRSEVEETVTDVRVIKRASMLGPDRVAEMKGLVETYYQAVRNAGEDAYRDSQANQAKYEVWLSDYVTKNPR